MHKLVVSKTMQFNYMFQGMENNKLEIQPSVKIMQQVNSKMLVKQDL